MAEGGGFEPPRHLAAPYRFSKPAPSASWVTLQNKTFMVLAECLAIISTYGRFYKKKFTSPENP